MRLVSRMGHKVPGGVAISMEVHVQARESEYDTGNVLSEARNRPRD
jgi:hypothetical protein